MSKKKILGSKSFFKDIEARVLPVGIIIILLFAVISTFFVPTIIAESQVENEDFEDDTEGQDPSDSWYTYDEIDTCGEVNTTQAKGGTKSFKFDPDLSGVDYAFFNCTQSNYTWFNVSIWTPSSSDTGTCALRIHNGTMDSTGTVAGVVWNAATGTTVQVYNESGDGGSTNELIPAGNWDVNVWIYLNFSFNYTTHLWRLDYNNTNDTGWTDMPYDMEHFDIILCKNANNEDNLFYMDDMNLANWSAPPGGSSPSNYTLDGLDGSSRITWTGEADTTVWSNATDPGGTLVFYTELNVSENCSDIIVDFSGSLNIGGLGILENLSVDVDVDNSSWTPGTTVTVNVTNGGNISLNGSWSDLTAEGNPFVIKNSDGNYSIFLRISYAIPSGTSADTYTTTSTPWKIKWKIIEP